jgi:chromosome partitioning protein
MEKRGRIIALITSKGGSGKTTLACCLAGELLHRGQPVTLIDADPQAGGGCAQWHSAGGRLGDLPLLIESSERAAVLAREAAENGSTVVIDSAGALTRTTAAILGVCDVALIPTRPSGLDAARAIEMAQMAQGAGAGAVAAVITGTTRSALPAHIRSELKGAGVKVLRTEIGQRVAFPTAMLYGSAPCFMGSSAAKAAAEVAQLANELSKL